MMDDIKSVQRLVNNSSAKIETIEKTVNSINQRMADIDEKTNTLDKRVAHDSMEESCSFLSTQHDQQATTLKEAADEAKCLTDSCKSEGKTYKIYNNFFDYLKIRMIEIETRSMGENLIFYGIIEQESDKCETMVKELIEQKLNIETNNMKFGRAHRMGDDSAKKPRPVVLKFHDYHKRELGRQKVYDSRDILKQSNHGIGIQRPKAVRDARKALYATVQRERASGNAVQMIGDKLYVNEALYKPT